ncbi:hypothetical protein D3C87_1830710 [compost metagenome]
MPAAGEFPDETFAQIGGADRQQHEVGLAVEMQAQGFGQLRGGGEMHVAVRRIDGHAVIVAGQPGRGEAGAGGNLVDEFWRVGHERGPRTYGWQPG